MKKPKLPKTKQKIVSKTGTPKRKPKAKAKYKVRNWAEYNNALVRRGSLEVWIEEGLVQKWEVTKEQIGPKKRGGQLTYSDTAIETTLLVGKVYHQRLRQTEGFMQSIVRLSGVNLQLPDFSTLSRRGGGLTVVVPKQAKNHVVAIVDSTGLKLYGEGEWKVRRYGLSQHRRWLKLPISIADDGELRAVIVTGNEVTDGAGGKQLLEEQALETIAEFVGDGGYDQRKVYEACQKHHIPKVVIPPQHKAKIWLHGNTKGAKHPRDENLRAIRRTTRAQWKETSGYHIRSKAETTMYRAKTTFGDRVWARKPGQQQTEVTLMAAALNKMLYLGMPDS